MKKLRKKTYAKQKSNPKKNCDVMHLMTWCAGVSLNFPRRARRHGDFFRGDGGNEQLINFFNKFPKIFNIKNLKFFFCKTVKTESPSKLRIFFELLFRWWHHN